MGTYKRPAAKQQRQAFCSRSYRLVNRRRLDLPDLVRVIADRAVRGEATGFADVDPALACPCIWVLKPADDALIVDTSEMAPEQVLAALVDVIERSSK